MVLEFPPGPLMSKAFTHVSMGGKQKRESSLLSTLITVVRWRGLVFQVCSAAVAALTRPMISAI